VAAAATGDATGGTGLGEGAGAREAGVARPRVSVTMTLMPSTMMALIPMRNAICCQVSPVRLGRVSLGRQGWNFSRGFPSMLSLYTQLGHLAMG
jgi:hypothetical protein